MEFYFRKLSGTSTAWPRANREGALAEGGSHPPELPGAPERLVLYEAYLALVLTTEVAYRGFGAAHAAWARGYLSRSLRAIERSK